MGDCASWIGQKLNFCWIENLMLSLWPSQRRHYRSVSDCFIPEALLLISFKKKCRFNVTFNHKTHHKSWLLTGSRIHSFALETNHFYVSSTNQPSPALYSVASIELWLYQGHVSTVYEFLNIPTAFISFIC